MKVKIVSNEKELTDAFSIRKTVFINEQHVPAEEEIDEHDKEAIHFVLYDDKNSPIGAGRFRALDSFGKAERICVLKEFRKSGAGRAIMNKIEEYAKSQGILELKLNAQTHAIRFYQNLNYEIISEEFLDAGIPHRTMKKKLQI